MENTQFKLQMNTQIFERYTQIEKIVRFAEYLQVAIKRLFASVE